MTSRPALPAALLSLTLALAACGSDAEQAGPAPTSTTTTSTTATASDRPTEPTEPTADPKPDKPKPDKPKPDKPEPDKPKPSKPAPLFGGRRVLAISVDGLNPEALVQLGKAGAPNIWRLLDEGLGTLNARTELEQTVTLPNHTGMVTGRPIDPRVGGHGVTWNEDLPGRTVQGAAGERVESIFTSVHDAGGSTGVFAGKSKFSLWERSWPLAIDDLRIDADLDALSTSASIDLIEQSRALTFVHLLEPDATGHAAGFMSAAYLDGVRRADAAVGRLLGAIGEIPVLRRTTVVILTADHGGTGPGHGDPALPADYTIPFVIWGEGVPAGDLYEATPGLADPGTGRPTYDGPQPVRNCDLADVAATILELAPVPGSVCDAGGEIRPFG